MNKLCGMCHEPSFEFAHNRLIGYHAFCTSCGFRTDYFREERILINRLPLIFEEEFMAFEMYQRKTKKYCQYNLEKEIYILSGGKILIGEETLAALGVGCDAAFLIDIDMRNNKIISNLIRLRAYKSVADMEQNQRRNAFKCSKYKNYLLVEIRSVLKEFGLTYYTATPLEFKIDAKKHNLSVDLTDLLKNRREESSRPKKKLGIIAQQLSGN